MQNPNEPIRDKQPEHVPAGGTLVSLWAKASQHGRREILMRYAAHLSFVIVLILGLFASRQGLDVLPAGAAQPPESGQSTPGPTAVPTAGAGQPSLPEFLPGGLSRAAVYRQADLHTVLPDRPRIEIAEYEVKDGDTLFGIAEKFGLKPETVLWGNYDVLLDDPHTLKPGQELNILPVDGTLYKWNEGDGLNGVAKFFGVTAEDIINWPGNNLDPDTDPSSPGITPGTSLIIPGGQRQLVTWSAPRITRSNPGVAKILGPGACGALYDGPVGTGSFIWPSANHYLSGFDYSSIHPAIDIAGHAGDPVWAADNGVVVYSGWNDWGYGQVVVIDHGNGWQTLYAHLSQINVSCGAAVYQGSTTVGLMGCTGNCSGPHLHFEMMNDAYGKVNPWNFLP
jgi:murein DD-endopeptidase MepM/ murein hydrolase activator NlpD